MIDRNTKENVSFVFATEPKKQRLTPDEAGPLFVHALPQKNTDIAAFARRLRLNPDYTFENFAVSSTNQLAYAAATAVAKTPGTAYNPLFVYGGVGVGKTHLVHAVANRLLRDRPTMRIVCCMGEEFLNEIVEAIQTK